MTALLGTLLCTGFAGFVLGVGYFAGLWWTVRSVARGDGSAGWLVISFAVRAALLLAGFWIITWGTADRLLACLIGFILARQVTLAWLPTTPSVGVER